jgi:hypothetical protein
MPRRRQPALPLRLQGVLGRSTNKFGDSLMRLFLKIGRQIAKGFLKAGGKAHPPRLHSATRFRRYIKAESGSPKTGDPCSICSRRSDASFCSWIRRVWYNSSQLIDISIISSAERRQVRIAGVSTLAFGPASRRRSCSTFGSKVAASLRSFAKTASASCSSSSGLWRVPVASRYKASKRAPCSAKAARPRATPPASLASSAKEEPLSILRPRPSSRASGSGRTR